MHDDIPVHKMENVPEPPRLIDIAKIITTKKIVAITKTPQQIVDLWNNRGHQSFQIHFDDKTYVEFTGSFGAFAPGGAMEPPMIKSVVILSYTGDDEAEWAATEIVKP